uniref:Uncharacterized protein n=1 Tax=Buteo japonicus TaxID=224669 RepID=A0A8C0APC7_9AVES
PSPGYALGHPFFLLLMTMVISSLQGAGEADVLLHPSMATRRDGGRMEGAASNWLSDPGSSDVNLAWPFGKYLLWQNILANLTELGLGSQFARVTGGLLPPQYPPAPKDCTELQMLLVLWRR